MYYRKGWIDKLERKFGRFSIKNLMLILIGAMVIVWLMDLMITNYTGYPLTLRLIFSRTDIFQGEVWRIFTFLFIPPYQSGIAWLVFALYFYYSMGAALEAHWGSFGFTAFYLLGAIGAIASGFITGYATNTYLNLSMFLAYAILFPKNEFRLFFLIPIEARWLALADVILLANMFINTSWSGRVGIISAFVNLLIFFTPHLIDHIKSLYSRIKWKRNFRK